VYNEHSNFINNIVLTSDFSNFGMPVDNLSTDTSVAVSSRYFYSSQILVADLVLGWSLFAAAMTKNQSLSSELISRVSNRASSSNLSGVFPVYYGSIDGSILRGAARCVN
jgi:hypothetical protein